MLSPDIHILIPCHSLEDFPTEQTDLPAASLLNAFAVAYHPALLAWAGEIPRWRRADDPPLPRRGQLVIIPTVADGWMAHSWADDARLAGATVVSGLSDRHEMLAAALKALEVDLNESTELGDPAANSANPEETSDAGRSSSSPNPAIDGGVSGAVVTSSNSDGNASNSDGNAPHLVAEPLLPESASSDQGEISAEETLDPDLVADFFSLGTCWLLIELLTRRMRQFGNLDDSRFFQRAQAGAKAALAEDRETAETHLRSCFEMLLEARERFYPVECYLLDLCLAVPEMDYEKLIPDSKQSVPWSLLVSTDDLQQMCDKTPELKPALSEAWKSGRISIVGGEDREASLPLLPLESLLYHFRQGRATWQQLLDKTPTVWGRRRFGLTALLPQILVKFGFQAALHVVLDDGIYPDAEYTKLRWRGVDGTLIDALSRIPLAAEGAASYLRFPVRMAESMDHDQVAGLILARWPEIEAPWFEDLRRSQKYAPCLGRFVTLDRFFEQTEIPGQLSVYKSNEYFSPYLIQHVARRENRPISRYADHALQRRRFDAASWYHATADVLVSKPVVSSPFGAVEQRLETPSPDPDPSLQAELSQQEQQSSARLAAVIMHGAGSGSGFLVLNPLSFARRVVVPLPGIATPPTISGGVKAVEFDAANPARTACVVDLPGSGYAWIPANPTGGLPQPPKQPLAEKWLLRNDLFEVALNERTGGIAHIRFHEQRAKRLSQQLSYRFPRERTLPAGPVPGPAIKSQYAEMICLGHEILCSGTACGEIVTFGEIRDQVRQEKLATFRQTIRVWRACPTLEIEIELSDIKPIEGDPWNNYFASRFAWNDGTAAVTRSICHTAQDFIGERFETSDYIEIASESERLTIVPHGLPFHRKTGDRMVDSLLLVAGETERKFRFDIVVDAPYPLEAAWNATTPVLVVPTKTGPPRAGLTGWFFHVDARHVQLTRVLALQPSSTIQSPLEHCERVMVPDAPGFAVRLTETEGRSKPVKLRCFRQPTFARKRDFRGETLAELQITSDAVVVDMSPFEIADVELRF